MLQYEISVTISLLATNDNSSNLSNVWYVNLLTNSIATGKEESKSNVAPFSSLLVTKFSEVNKLNGLV